MLEYPFEKEEKDERSSGDGSDISFEEPPQKIPLKNTQKQAIIVKKKDKEQVKNHISGKYFYLQFN